MEEAQWLPPTFADRIRCTGTKRSRGIVFQRAALVHKRRRSPSVLASSTTWSHLHARSPCVFHEFTIAGESPPAPSIFATTPTGNTTKNLCDRPDRKAE